MNGSLTADDHSLEESGTLRIISLAHGMGSQLGFCLSHDSFVTDLQHFPVFHGEVTDAVIEVVARCENVMLHGEKCLICHKGGSEIACGFALPVFVDLVKLLLRLLGNMERIGCSGGEGVKLILHPAEGILWKNLAASGHPGVASHDQLPRPDRDRKLLADRLKGFCSS